MLKPVSSATETRSKIEISPVVAWRSDINASKNAKNKDADQSAGICSTSLLFAKPKDRFSRIEAQLINELTTTETQKIIPINCALQVYFCKKQQQQQQNMVHL